ncbi:hypothetical protein RvY_01710 [Ramazzottius varieornatus]|uniref:SAM-dependent MTase TRM10-type domain-containing protein n=1 Tax=Ramazzottius varieornatus TaxID=947166 RepID=A0A1D1UN94_RAMVA|nr:hypothetical protein RvY_01710 [Ramazzottius varieornatus]
MNASKDSYLAESAVDCVGAADGSEALPASETLSTGHADAQPEATRKPVLSKNALKKELKFKKRAELLKQRRPDEKEQRKRKKLAARRRLNQQMTMPGEEIPSNKVARRRILEKLSNALTNGVKLVVDMSFVDIMSPKEIGQLASQICYMYSSNKKFANPFCLNLCSFVKGTTLYDEVLKRCSGFEHYKIRTHEEPLEKVFAKEDIVYCSPDSPNVLEKIDPAKVYVIGGLVDGSPKTRASMDRAEGIGCQTVRLPIKEHMKRIVPHGSSTILTLNQVYEILMKLHETGSWEVALKNSIPQRKGFVLNTEAGKQGDAGTAQEIESEHPEDSTSSSS